jgi:RNA polymerase sigma-54 factor
MKNKVSQKQIITQKQSLSINQATYQSLNILQLSSIDLLNYINQELQQNPFLEITKDDNESESDQYYAISNNNYEYDINSTPMHQSLHDFLNEQIHHQIDEKNKNIAFYLTDYIDKDGYLRIDEVEICKYFKISLKTLEKIIQQLQILEPTGVFARNLQECLTLQLKEKKLFTSKMKIIIDNLNLVADNNFKELEKQYQVNNNDIKHCIKIIKTLNPKPGNKFINLDTSTLEPDLYVTFHNNDIKVELNENLLPKVMLNKEYYSTIKNVVNANDDKQYINMQYTSASNVIKSVDQRTKTLLKVATSIISYQNNFFTKGIRFLKPMNLIEVANDLNLHESTVSRVISNKYMHTPMGTYSLKFFFPSGFAGKQNINNHSATSIKDIIANLIENEKSNILSDQDICGILATNYKINIARRTVAKYRESANIPTSAERKRKKRLISSMN